MLIFTKAHFGPKEENYNKYQTLIIPFIVWYNKDQNSENDSLNIYGEEFPVFCVYNIEASKYFAIDTLDSKTNHVDIMSIIKFYHKQREYF